ncbi:MAG: alginate export family protein [Acidobacteria bacterium]|nr:alginate export family protein [Acidobacteriota bacterium]
MSSRVALLLYMFFSVDAVLAQEAGAVSPVHAAASANSSVTVRGSIRARAEIWNWFAADSADNTYTYSGNLIRLSLTKSSERGDWQVEFAMPLLLGLPDRAIASGTPGQLGLGASYFAANDQSRTAAMLFPKQLFFRWKNPGGVAGQSLQIGRFEFSDGAEYVPAEAVVSAVKRDRINQRLIGTFAFTHTGRSFDGARYSLDRKSSNLTLVAAVPTRGVFQTDGWGWNRAGFGYAAYTREWGKGKHAAETRFFTIEYADWRRVLKADNRPATSRREDTAMVRIETFAGHTVHAVSASVGTVDLLAWGAVQTGRWGAQKHRAWSMDVEAGFQPKGLAGLNPWLRVGFTRGSGDENPGDATHETFFQLLPTPRPYARFPFFNMMNIEDRFGSLVLRPHSKVTVSGEYHSLRLANAGDLWYAGGGVFHPWTFGYTGRPAGGARSLANLYDAQLDYRLSPAVSIGGYFGFAQGLSVVRAIYPGGQNGRFGYVDMTFRF